jgi:nicotinamidase-related amidase
MPADNQDNLRGAKCEKCSVALVLLDILTGFDFPGGDILAEEAASLRETLPPLIRRARAAGVPVIYVNDNWGQWRSDRRELVEHFLRPESRGRTFVQALRPEKEDYLVLKPKHSGFYGTTLELLLETLGVRTLVLTGLAGNICVLFTAQDAYLREYRLVIPRDGLASQTPRENEQALEHMRNVLRAETPSAQEVDFAALASEINR